MKLTSRSAAWFSAVLLLCTAFPVLRGESLDTLKADFAAPPAAARPWVYWMWMSSNLSREGITADLEAMSRVGLGGALIMDVEDGTPLGPMKFMDGQWQGMFQHAIAEAKRLHLEINMNNGAGYTGSGGSWVPPEKGMQWVYNSEVHVPGGARWTGVLAKPRDTADYRDIAVLAVAEPAVAPADRYQIPDFTMKSLSFSWKIFLKYRGTQSAPLTETAPAAAIIPLQKVIDLTGKMSPDGTLAWEVPPGEWTILRLGHAYNGSEISPTPEGQGGPETDKLSREATVFHFNAMVKRLNEIVGPAGRSVLIGTHIDSWEGGGQNWTPAMRQEFLQRRGYDPLPYLPILTGRVLGDLQTTERFLWDLRKTVSELMVQNYAAEFRRLAHEQGLRFSFESYTTTGNDLDAANWADEPMAEFWTPIGNRADFNPTRKSMSSAAHLNQRPIVGAEAMTASDLERWLWHPAMLKRVTDEAFCEGINRLVFHRYAAQRFLNRWPGIQMGPWGLHYERTNTWWEWTGPWHAYLTRCQYLLRQGEFVADVLRLQSEEPLHRFQTAPLTGFDYDACGTDTFKQVTVRDGRLTLPTGRQYRLLVLPDSETMTVPQLARIRDLVRAGAAVVGPPPRATPGLTDFPRADVELKKIASELWGPDAPRTERAFGQGRVFCGISPENALERMGVKPDFTADVKLNWMHRVLGDTDVYFVANPSDDPVTATCAFRPAGNVPELWDPETGRTAPLLAGADSRDGLARLSLPLGPSGSVFVVFHHAVKPPSNLVTVTRDGQTVWTDGPAAAPAAPVDLVAGEISQPGRYVFTAADGETHTYTVPALPAPATVTGAWSLSFPDGWGAPGKVELDRLISWSLHADDGVRHFSGTAHYARTLAIPPALLAARTRLYLDLGKVQVMARVKLNGRDLGILWKPPYRVDITAAAKPGDNTLEIAVVNLWPNQLIGDERFAEDSDRNPKGTLKAWPEWLLAGKPSPTGRRTFSSWRQWKKDDPLQESGLLGPVTLQDVAIFSEAGRWLTPQ